METKKTPPAPAETAPPPAAQNPAGPAIKPPAPDPTRYGDWEKNGKCIDF